MFLPLVSWTSGSIIMTVVFGLVCIGLVIALLLLVNSESKKK